MQGLAHKAKPTMKTTRVMRNRVKMKRKKSQRVRRKAMRLPSQNQCKSLHRRLAVRAKRVKLELPRALRKKIQIKSHIKRKRPLF